MLECGLTVSVLPMFALQMNPITFIPVGFFFVLDYAYLSLNWHVMLLLWNFICSPELISFSSKF